MEVAGANRGWRWQFVREVAGCWMIRVHGGSAFYVRHPTRMNSSWPISWQGNTNIDCGDDGSFMAVVTTESQPTGAHAQTFQLICSHWQEIWPSFRQIITELMESYKREAPDWSRVSSVYISVPDEPIVEDAEWSVGVVFFGSDTLWSLPYRGLSACPQQAQAIY